MECVLMAIPFWKSWKCSPLWLPTDNCFSRSSRSLDACLGDYSTSASLSILAQPLQFLLDLERPVLMWKRSRNSRADALCLSSSCCTLKTIVCTTVSSTLVVSIESALECPSRIEDSQSKEIHHPQRDGSASFDSLRNFSNRETGPTVSNNNDITFEINCPIDKRYIGLSERASEIQGALY